MKTGNVTCVNFVARTIFQERIKLLLHTGAISSADEVIATQGTMPLEAKAGMMKEIIDVRKK